MNNKAINEFGFRRIWRIKQISEAEVDSTLPDLVNSSYPTYESWIHQLLITPNGKGEFAPRDQV